MTYRFTHAFFRQTLYEETIAPRRIRLHQQVARALETVYGRRLEEHATELAEHYAYSSDPSNLAKAVSYGELAARRALGVFAYGEAERHLEQALKVQEVLDPDDSARRCDLLLALGEALIPAGEPLRAAETVAPQALALADGLGDQVRASRACEIALSGLVRHGGSAARGTPEFGRWLEEADRRAPPGSLDRVRTDLRLAGREYNGNRQRAGLELNQRALALARELDDDEALFTALGTSNLRLPDFQEERLRIAQEFSDRPQGRASALTYGIFLNASHTTFLAWGERARAEEALRRAKELAERTKNNSLLAASLREDLLFTVIDGRLEEAAQEAEQVRTRAEELGVPGPTRQFTFNYTLRALCYLGRAQEALAAQPPAARTAVAEGRSLVFAADSALFLAHLGRWEEVRALLGRLGERLRAADTSFDLSYAPLTNYLEAAVLAGDRELAALIQPRLDPVSGLINEMFPTVIARHLGGASALLGDHEQAMRYYEQAFEVCAKVGFRSEAALTHLQMAELLLGSNADSMNRAPTPRGRREASLSQAGEGQGALKRGDFPPSVVPRAAWTGEGEPQGTGGARAGKMPAPPDARAQALRHLDFAIAELREMKMQPVLERALRHKEVLKA